MNHPYTFVPVGETVGIKAFHAGSTSRTDRKLSRPPGLLRRRVRTQERVELGQSAGGEIVAGYQYEAAEVAR